MDTSNSSPLSPHLKGFSFEKEKKRRMQGSPNFLLPGIFGINRCFKALLVAVLLELSCSQDQKMFVTILFGDSRMEMFNLNCKLINFIHHLKERCGLGFKEWVDLMDSSGRVMNLEGKQRSVALASSVLVERQHYVLLRVCRDDDTGDRKYVSLLNNFSQSHPELTELLRKLSNPDKERDKKTRGGRTQKNSPAKQTRSKNICANNKSHQIK
ncbi:uncharacterized protein C22orf15 [Siniperca chuatsi]|uniref:uncharacterized protein C22orf15 n=1 Tax=Siniperca chuatsi TaxID=119488 RepID=UPI001CE12C1A|nr:uncharacterized protein C22orf15 [Siniperca chuatsi]XP_044054115.1 uncharacterized protein C22orf15 [Siniperca chuatsi]XP_044054116.1 uncharacterized protein C22orf15 [Siniperca chuatsi]